MTYQVLARSWRPQRFADLLGQEAAVQTLSNALTSGNFGQAYVFSGLRGVGKTTVARLLAKAVNCVEGPTASPCGVCVSCREIAEGSSIDVIEMDAATHTGVDNVRDLQELVRYHPTRDRYRVIIVDEVHMLSKGAFNALLKTIEEPPSYILWVFATTERSKVPDTILSRCQQLDFRPVAADLIRSRLEEIATDEGFSLTPSAAASIAGAAGGSVRDALSLLDQLRAFAADEINDEAVATVLGVPPLEITTRLVELLGAGETTAGLVLLRDQLAAGQEPSILFQEVGRTLRSLLYLSLDPTLVATISDAHRALLMPIAKSFGPDPLARMLGLWLEHESLLKAASNRELALEVAAIRLARWPSVQKLEAWLNGSVGLPPAGGTAPETGSAPETGGAGSQTEERSPRQAAPVEPAAATAPVPDPPDPAPAELVPEAAPVDDDLEQIASDDPGVVLATRVLGGQVVAVRPDREGS